MFLIQNGIFFIKTYLNKDMIHELSECDICNCNTEFSRISDNEELLVCMPILQVHKREPNLSFVIKNSENIENYMQ